MTRIGIDMDQYGRLLRDPDARVWFDRLKAALDNVFEIVALDESCTRWEAHQYAWPRRRFPIADDDLRTYTTVLYTPPARPEWLVQLFDNDPHPPKGNT